MTEIRKSYVKVTDNGKIYYGGCQTASDNKLIKKCGCGIVAAADLIIYLKSKGKILSPLSIESYNKFLKYLKENYFPLIPTLGLNALVLTGGINLYFKNRELPYSALWLASGNKLFERIEQQLSEDIPVIMSVGPNFPLVWQNKRLDLYIKKEGEYIKTASAKAHYVTATGIDENYIRISSWGRELYIEKFEFMAYMKNYSNSLLCNMLQIKKR